MKSLLRVLRRFWMSFFLLCCGCVGTQVQQDVSLFESPETFVGREVELVGVLRFVPGNYNLFPTDNTKRDFEMGLCVPVGIAKSDVENVRLAESLNGRRVRLVGEMRDLVSREVVSTSFCKKTGVWVDRIIPE